MRFFQRSEKPIKFSSEHSSTSLIRGSCVALRLIRTFLLLFLIFNSTNAQKILAQDTDFGSVFNFDFQSGIHRLYLNGDDVPDLLTIGYISGGTGYAQFEFNFLIVRPPSLSAQSQEFYTVIPDDSRSNYFTTLQNADCVLRSIRLVKLGIDQDGWKLVILERIRVPEPGFTESPVEFRLLRFREAPSAGSATFSYRQVTQVDSINSYCNVDDAFENEWDRISEVFERSVESL